MINRGNCGSTPERRGPGRVHDDISPERLVRYLPANLRGVVERMPSPTSPEGRFAWHLAMRYAIRTHGRGWFKSHAELRLAELLNCTPDQILELAATDPEFIQTTNESTLSARDVREKTPAEVA